jgi:hypothetical protein
MLIDNMPTAIIMSFNMLFVIVLNIIMLIVI